MAFAIIADFLLGTYRARRADTSLDLLPSPARLHAALVNAAAQGSTAVEEGGALMPSSTAREALDWFEHHPPDGLSWPEHLQSGTDAVAYREKGLFTRAPGATWLPMRPGGRADGCVALKAPLAWTWSTDPPAPVATTIDALCADVGYLGTADSPVVLRVGHADPSHEVDPSASVFSGSGVDVMSPTPGRRAALEAAHRRDAIPIPTMTGDKASTGESERHLATVIDKATTVRFVRRAKPADAGDRVPWDRVVIVPIDATTHPDGRVPRAVAVHRALVSIIGDDAPSLVTGHYLPDVPVPANRLAIQFIQHDDPTSFSLPSAGAMLLMVPADAQDSDLAVLDRALRSLSVIRTRSTRIQVTDRPWIEDGRTFWRPTAPGHHRAWTTDPVAIPESLPVRGRRWTLDEAALLSIGFVFRDEVGRRRSGREGYTEMIDTVAGRGVRVLASQLAYRPDGGRFIHRARKEMVVQPYRVVVDLGTLHPADGVLAIGQSRHLGGGFLRPVDVLSEEMRA